MTENSVTTQTKLICAVCGSSWTREGSPARCPNKDCKGIDGQGNSVPIVVPL